MLLLVDNPKSSCSLIHFVNRMKKSGLYIIGHVTPGDFDLQIKDPTVDQHLAWMDLINHLNVKAFVDLTIAPSVRAGAQHIISRRAQRGHTSSLNYTLPTECSPHAHVCSMQTPTGDSHMPS